MESKKVKYKIILIRHGKPDVFLLADSKQKVKINEMKEFFVLYKKSGVDLSYLPKERLISIIPQIKKTYTSKLNRAVQSARYFGLFDDNNAHQLFNEAELPLYDKSIFKFTPKDWQAILRILWFLGFSKNTYSLRQTIKRASEAAYLLKNEVIKEECIALFGHGVFNYFIKNELVKNGGILSNKWDYDYWGCNEIIFYQ